VVGSDLPFIRKVIVDNGVGLVFDANDPRDIAEAINSITLDEAFEKAKLNVEKVKQLYSWENESQKLLAAISTLVSTGK
jgi:glycosyltransferase involved in cell wall biosynthesis